ncbi:LOW QUALITY PROTEIN: Protein CBG17020, partial [Caenorhabditis briggsae]
ISNSIMIFLLFLISFSFGNAASINKTETDLSTCVKEFYTAVYSENYNCTSQYNFASNNETVAQKSLISGKSCALEILGKACTQSQFTEIFSKFENFVKSLTTEPKDKNCIDSYYKYNALKCMESLNSLGEKSKLILQMQPKINDSRVLKLIDQCEGFKTCMSSNCYYFKTEVSIVSFCETVKMSNSEFKACEWKIERESPDLSEYECLEGDDFYDPAILNKYRFYTKMKDCTKEIMMDICGEKAVVGFEKYAELSADFLIKKNAKGYVGVFKFAKSCFLEVAKPECSSSQYNLLSTKYDDFLKMITEEPKSVTSCESFYFKYNSMKCIPIMMDITHKVVPLAQKHLKVNDSRLVALVDSCDLVKACMSPLCFFNDIEKSMITEACNAIELRNTKFSECISEIQKESPDLSEYKCLKGVDFNSKEPTIQIDKFSKNKACTKQIMEDFCGKEAVENFDEYAEITAEKV